MYSLSVGEIFHARYSILAQLGRGGMGEVYRARQLDIGRDVALKLLPFESIDDENDRQRFLREFKNLNSLSHPNIMSFYGMAITDAGIPYAVCEFIEGKNLRKLLLEQEKMPWQKVLKIWVQVCAGMQAAHEAGIVHRDLKPDNIMLLDKPEPDFVKLIDFGLSRAIGQVCENSQRLTFTGQLIGSVHYMSPEQSLGKPVDQRSDIYSLGCLVFEALLGEKYLDADNPIAILHQHANSDAGDRLQVLSGIVPASLCQILLKTLQKSPDQRYSSMLELKTELEHFQKDKEAQIVKSFSLARTKRHSKGLFKMLLMGCGSLLLLLVLVSAGQRMFPQQRAFSTLDHKETRTLLPKDGNSAHKLVEGLINANRLNEAEKLANAWLGKYENSGAANPHAIAALFRDIFRVRSKKSPNRFEDYDRLISRSRELLSRFQPSIDDAEGRILCAGLLDDLANWYYRGAASSSKDKEEATSFYKAECKLLEGSDLGSPIWDSPLALVHNLLNCGCYSDADAFLKLFLKHLAFVDRQFELKESSNADFYSLDAEVAVILDQPARALEDYEHLRTALGERYKDLRLRASKRLNFSLKEPQMMALNPPVIDTLNENEYLDRLVDLTEKANYLSSPRFSAWLTETINECKKAKVEKNTWVRWLRLRQPAALNECWSEALVCSKRACSDYQSEKLKSSEPDETLANLYLSYSLDLMQLGKTKEALQTLQQATAKLSSDKSRHLAQVALYKSWLSVSGCRDNAIAFSLKREALESAKKSENAIVSGSKSWLSYFYLAALYKTWSDDANTERLCALGIQALKNASSNDRITGGFYLCPLLRSRGKEDEFKKLLDSIKQEYKCEADFRADELPAFLSIAADLMQDRKYETALKFCQDAIDSKTLTRAQLLKCKLIMIKCQHDQKVASSTK